MEGQQKGLKWQWAWGKVVRAVADWKRQQMEMRKLDWSVEKSVRFGIFWYGCGCAVEVWSCWFWFVAAEVGEED